MQKSIIESKCNKVFIYINIIYINFRSPTKRLPNPLIRFNYMIMIYAEREQDIHDVKMMLENVLQNPYRYVRFYNTYMQNHE